MVIGNKVIHFKTINSTNEYVKHNLNNLADGDLVRADEQTKGKGRFGKGWYSPEGGLWFSIILKPKKPALVSLVIGVALCDSLIAMGFKPHIKWPNDILLNSKKVAGILTEIEANGLIIGIGLNVNMKNFPDVLKNTATSLSIETGKDFDKEKVLAMILKKIKKKYQMLTDNKTNQLLEAWRHYSITIGKEVIAELPNCQITGKAVDIDEDGGLLVKVSNGSIHKIIAGDCTIRAIVRNRKKWSEL